MNYTIPKGKHSAKFTIDRLQPFAKTRKGKFMIPESNWYPRELVKNPGWNKLPGLSGLRIHRNSARLVWMPDYQREGFIKIATYVYKDGVRSERLMGYIKCDIWCDFEVFFDNDWRFRVDEVKQRIPGKKPFVTFKTFPYFGGLDRAYKTMKFYFRH